MSALTKKLFILGILSFVLLSANIGGYSIYITDEARNAQCAREMWERGDLIVPTFNQNLRTDKPPLHYFFMALSYSIFGVSPFAARIFSSLFGVGLVLITFLFARRFINESVANWSAIVLLSSLGFITQFHLAVPDPYLIFFMAAALIAYFFFDQGLGTKYLYLAYVSVGLGVLAKGPVAIVIPGLVIFIYILFRKKYILKHLLDLRPIEGILIVLFISVPWYILVHIKTDGEWTRGFFLDHNVNRFNSPKEGHGGSFLLPTLFAFASLLPFSVFFPQAIKKALKKKIDPVFSFSLIAIVVVIVFFSIASTKLPSYISPIFPFAALLIGSTLNEIRFLPKWSFQLSHIFYLLTGIAIWFAVFKFVPDVKGLQSLTDLHWFFLALPLLATANVILASYNRRQWILFTMSAGFIITHQLFFYFAYPRVDQVNPVNLTAETVKNAENLVYYKRMNQAYPWLLGEEIVNAKTIENLDSILNAAPNTIVISRPKYLDELKTLPLQEVEREVDILDNTTTILLKKADQ